MSLTEVKTYPRSSRFPLPTVAQIEDALDTLLTALAAHEDTFVPDPDSQSGYYLKDLQTTEFLPGEKFIADPIGRSLREGIRELGKTLFALTNSTDAMLASCERVCDRDPKHWGFRTNIVDKRWNGIGSWVS